MGFSSLCFPKRNKNQDRSKSVPNPITTVKTDGLIYTKTINGHQIAFTDYGYANSGPPIVTFSGWNQDHRGWSDIIPYLIETHRVISPCFRGHGPNRDPVEDFGFEEHAQDVITLLDSLGVDKFICLAASHGSWAAMSVAQIAGSERMPAILISDLVMTASPQFYGAMQALQGEKTWRPTVEVLFKSWGAGSTNDAFKEQLLKNSGGYGFETWARSGRTIEAAYKQWGSPMKRMEDISNPPLIRHVFTQSVTPGYDDLHKEFQQKHPEWFSYLNVRGDTHFPHIENPEPVSATLKDLITKAVARSVPGRNSDIKA